MRAIISQRVVREGPAEEARDALAHDWAKLFEHIGWDFIPIPNTLPDPVAFFNAIDPDAVVFSGGGVCSGKAIDVLRSSSATSLTPEECRDRTELCLLEHAVCLGVPVVGVCRGFHAINVFRGGEMPIPVSGHVTRSHVVEFIDRQCNLNSYHDLGLTQSMLAPGLVPLARSADSFGSVEAFCDLKNRLTGFQWHPERQSPDQDFAESIFLKALRGTLEPTTHGTAA